MTRSIRFSLRLLFKYRLYTGINLIGLGIAITSCWFIANFLKNAHEYDAFHENHDRIYRLTMDVTAGGNTDHYATTGKPLGKLLSEGYSGFDAYAKMTYHDPVVHHQNELFKETGFFEVNPEALEVFTFDFITGSRETCFAAPYSILLSRSLAIKYFDGIDIIGKHLIVGDIQYTIQGVFNDLPKNSHLSIKALYYSEEASANYEAQDWFDLENYNYALLNQAYDHNDLTSKLAQLKTQHLVPILEGSGIDVQFHAQSLNELYFSPGLIDDVPKGNRMYIKALTFAGLFVILIAGLNYVNLSLTRSTQRAKEVLLKKMLGISRRQLLIQSALESFILAVLVFAIAT